MNGLRANVVLCSLLCVSACTPGAKPPAETPAGLSVLAIQQTGGSWVNVGAVSPGVYEILPGGLPSGGIRVYFSAPDGTALEVRLDGVILPKFEDIPAGSNSSATGYYRIFDINRAPTPAVWKIGIRPPDSKLANTSLAVSITDVSLEPSYTGAQHASAPLTFTAAPRKTFTLTVMTMGSGSGSVDSNPSSINCPPACSNDFGQSVTVNLIPHPATGSTFAGFTGACLGTGGCQVTLNGVALGVGATFEQSTTAPATNNCPAISAPAGYSWFDKPYCGAPNAFNDPTPELNCNAQEYFCCAKSTGANAIGCGTDHARFLPTCDYGNPNVKMETSGCYLKD